MPHRTRLSNSSQYTSFSSRKQAANAGSARKKFTENASLALPQTILTHAHTNCPPVDVVINDYIKTRRYGASTSASWLWNCGTD